MCIQKLFNCLNLWCARSLILIRSLQTDVCADRKLKMAATTGISFQHRTKKENEYKIFININKHE